MLKETIFIEKPINEVWYFIEMEFAKAFKCSPKALLGKTTTVDSMNFTGKSITVSQVVTIHDNQSHFAFTSENSKDRVESHYVLEADPEGTYLTTYEIGTGVQSKMRTLNYQLFTLPILRGSTKKKLRRRLEGLKTMIESEEIE